MSYKSDQYKNAVKFKASFKDIEEDGYILNVNGKPYRHFLKKRYLNLWEIIRSGDLGALAYFGKDGKEKDGMWHTNDYENNPKTIPEGNMLSSHVSCVNHLFLLRKNQDYATAILKNIDSRIVEAQIVDDVYIEFEVMGGKNQNPLGEKEQGILHGKKWKRQRGAFSTSIDALMIGKKNNGKNILVLIEWKYTEDGKKKFTPSSNHATYKKLLCNENCPINVHKNIEELLSEPYYQPMRQTLLGWKMVELSEYNCDEYIHLHIIPNGNDIFRNNLINWKNLLSDIQKYKVLSPEELLLPLRNNQSLKGFSDYLSLRYLEKYI